MIYSIYQLDFYNGVRFGKGRLETTEMTFHADTLFAALFQEALKLNCSEQFLSYIKAGVLRWSDAFPYKGKTLFVPKPMFQKQIADRANQGNSVKKKQFKKMHYIPSAFVRDYMQGNFPEAHLGDCQDIGQETVKTAVAVRGHEEPEPYRVSAYYFGEGNGLYLVLGSEDASAEELFDTLIESLSYSGLGGKKSAGLGRFEYMKKAAPKDLAQYLKNGVSHPSAYEEGRYAMLLSTALPEEDELSAVLEEATYQLLKRSGFVDSTTFDDQQMRKKDLYVLDAGSCFKRRFDGCMVKEINGGRHPVYRYAYSLFLEVSV